MRVLFVAYEFPPLGGAGIRRSLILTKYLSEFDVTPIVVTTDLASHKVDHCDLVDMKLLERIPPGIVVERIPCRRARPQPRSKLSCWLRSWCSWIDPLARRWRPQIEPRLPELISRHRPQAIFVTVPPFSMGPLWCSVAKKYGLPILLDFRDSWSQCGHTPYMSWLHYRAVLGAERRCLNVANAVVCVTDQIREDMLAAQPSADPTKFRVIPNGFDGEIPGWTAGASSAAEHKHFVIGHVGSFYYSPGARQTLLNAWYRRRPTRWTQYCPRREDWLYRSPYFFFRALAALFERRPELRQQIRVRFAGANPDWLAQQAAEFRLSDVVEFLGYLGHQECLEFQAACDCLLITSAKVIGGESYPVSSKSFEYVTAGKPILAVVAPGAQRDFVLQCGLALVCDPDDTAETAGKIESLVSRQMNLRPDLPFLSGYQGREVSRSMAAALRSTVRL